LGIDQPVGGAAGVPVAGTGNALPEEAADTVGREFDPDVLRFPVCQGVSPVGRALPTGGVFRSLGPLARPIRYEAAGAVYHVMARGEGGKGVFEDDTDRIDPLKLPGIRYRGLSP